MSITGSWQGDLKFVVDFMRDLSMQTDPQTAAELYGQRVRSSGFVPADRWLSVSRRDLTRPAYRITRSSTWKETVNPWTEKEKLPLFNSGLLGELIYSNEPAVIDNLQDRYAPDDPAAEYFKDMNFLLATPQFDGGDALNMTINMSRDPAKFPHDRIPTIVWQSNLWGRAVLSSMLRLELKKTYDALDRELKTVGEIQRSLLPETLPDIPGVDLAAHYQTSARAGGDYYDFFPMPDGRWGIFIADVAGHGIAAAVMMAITHAIAHTRPGCVTGPAEMLAYLNATLERRYTGHGIIFVTAVYALFDPVTRRLLYSSAGHPRPRLARDGVITELDGRAGLPLGIDSPEEYGEHEIALRSGDRLLFFTDGVSEAFNSSGEFFGTAGLDRALLGDSRNAEGLIGEILADLQRHCGDVPSADDRTLLAMRCV
jgi:sigma-B regulation protein RsbU (phosphoserine phosphatase)